MNEKEIVSFPEFFLEGGQAEVPRLLGWPQQGRRLPQGVGAGTWMPHLTCTHTQDVIEALGCSSHSALSTPQKLPLSMGPSQLLRAPRPGGLSSTRRGLGWPRPRFPKMFKCSRRRYRQKAQGPMDTSPASNLAARAREINSSLLTSMWLFPPQGEGATDKWDH
ncbi:PIK3R3 upstream open reading frame protein [Sorex araneus]|uniref:PIK3R3 upstream open reading frame protein n=1 Tax=Sorex araneus TaxID=42254 RepID=UPI0024333882|nr:PIK3R3 upstream open reading frame protein [Sorex araneus]